MSLSATVATAALTAAAATASKTATNGFFVQLLHGSSLVSKIELVAIALIILFCISSIILFVKLFNRLSDIEIRTTTTEGKQNNIETELIHCVRKDELIIFGQKQAQDFTNKVSSIQIEIAKISGAFNQVVAELNAGRK